MTNRHRHITALGLVAAATALGPAAQGALAARPAILGIQDDRLAHPQVEPADRMGLVAGLNAKLVRVDLRWDLVATARPTSPRDPADPAYNWAHYDKVVDAARARKVNIMFAVWGTPDWAADPKVPLNPSYPAFGRAPRSAADAGNFAAAAAKRYGPKGVKMWEAWNEPNIPLFLQPQAVRRGGRWVPVSPRRYSGIAKAIYRGIKSSDRTARVAGAVTAPAGDITCTHAYCRQQPDRFIRALNQKGLRPPMDAVSHHPYPITAPRTKTWARANYIDLYNVGRFQSAVDATYLRRKPLWYSEFGVATARVPQYPFFAPSERTQAAWLRDAVTRVRRNPRVKVFVWYLMQDHPEWKSGLLRENGSRKPAANTFRVLARR